MKKVKISSRETLIASILALKAMAPVGSVHCDDPTHCRVGL